MTHSTTPQRDGLVSFICALVGAVILFGSAAALAEGRMVYGLLLWAGLFGIWRMWCGWRDGWSALALAGGLAILWAILAEGGSLWSQLWLVIVIAVFLPLKKKLKATRAHVLRRRKVMGKLGDFAMSLLKLPWVVSAIESIPALDKLVNRIVIDRIVNTTRNRPHPLSTQSDYTSWSSMTDPRWSARHLDPSPIDQSTLPPWDRISALFERPEGQQRLCPKSTCLFPAFAQYLTDGFIRTNTDESDPDRLRKNTSNHNIDLCPLYGRTPEQTRILRVSNPDADQRGRLKSQMIDGEEFAPFLFDGDDIVPEFADLDPPLGLGSLNRALETASLAGVKKVKAKRAMLFAFGGDRANSVPQTAMINTLLLREHNRLAGELGKRNPAWDDDQVFETARNIVIVQFIKIVVQDYINHISPSAYPIKADPSGAWKAKWNRPNWITTEFSLLYRWHALIPETITWQGEALRTDRSYFMNNAPLLSGGLARAFEDISAAQAGELGPRNTASSLLHVEQLSIAQGRHCRLRPFTDYLEYLGRMPINSARDISSDPAVSTLLSEAYGDIDRVDFFAGIFCEDRVKNSPLPRTILSFVALDAFSQALTNPLLSEHVFTPPDDPMAEHPTFSRYGWDQIAACSTLRDLVVRNVADPTALGFVGMTRKEWRPV